MLVFEAFFIRFLVGVFKTSIYIFSIVFNYEKNERNVSTIPGQSEDRTCIHDKWFPDIVLCNDWMRSLWFKHVNKRSLIVIGHTSYNKKNMIYLLIIWYFPSFMFRQKSLITISMQSSKKGMKIYFHFLSSWFNEH